MSARERSVSLRGMVFVFGFDHEHPRPPMELKDLLGGKGANLAEMTSVLDLPVPPGFTISTDACRAYLVDGWPAGLDDEVAAHIGRLEAQMGKRLGDATDPLLGERAQRGQVLDAGDDGHRLGPGTQPRVGRRDSREQTDPRFAHDSYRRFIQMYGRVVLGVPGQEFDERFDTARARSGAGSDAEIPAEALADLVAEYEHVVEVHTGRPFPQDPGEQLRGRHRGRVPIVELAAGRGVPAARAHPRRCRNRGQRAGDGVRQP